MASRRPLDIKSGRVEMIHGAGGLAMGDLIDQILRPHLTNPILDAGNDAALLPRPADGDLAMTTDSYVVSPLFFPGGDIGSLAVHGTVNDLATGGAVPLHLSVGLVLEEGFPLADLGRIVASLGQAARQAGVTVVTGDTKVVERGRCDGVYINTAGLGVVPPGVRISGDRARPGDRVLISGSIGDHGIAIMSLRAGLTFETEIESDSAALHGLVADLLATSASGVRVLRDPTRGGLSACVNEIANQSGVGMLLDETAIPIKPEVHGACELLGLDPLNVANEGKLCVIVAPEDTDAVLAAMRRHPLGAESAVIGTVVEDARSMIRMTTAVGGERVVDWLAGEQLPRIC